MRLWPRSRSSISSSPRSASARRASGGARCVRGKGQREPGQDRRSRTAPERRARQEGAGACALPLRLLRQAARGAWRPRRTSRWSATASCFPSDVLFDSGSADLKPEAMPPIDKLADALKQLETQIPPDIAWVMRIDGHTDIKPITSAALPVELGAVVGPRDFRGALSDRPGRAAEPAGRRGLRRVPAASGRRQRRRFGQEPPHRAEAHRALELRTRQAGYMVRDALFERSSP